MINSNLLNNYIKRSKLSISYIAENLNISIDDFIKKKSNIKDFTVNEILKLVELLRIEKNPERVFFI